LARLGLLIGCPRGLAIGNLGSRGLDLGRSCRSQERSFCGCQQPVGKGRCSGYLHSACSLREICSSRRENHFFRGPTRARKIIYVEI